MEPKVATFEGPLQAMMANYYWAINGPLVVCLLGSTRKNYKTGTEKRDETRKRDLKITATDPKQTRFLIQLHQTIYSHKPSGNFFSFTYNTNLYRRAF
jgi:hypothetical protein